jgi:nucleoside-diphosphate-sugar epimerase
LKNRRSLIGVENLSDLLILCADSSAAAGELFLAAEAEFHSTPDLMRAIAKAMGRRSRLFRFPPKALRISAQIVGRRDQFDKFCGSLEVSAAKARRALGWNPRIGFDDGIARTAAWFLDPGHAAA